MLLEKGASPTIISDSNKIALQKSLAFIQQIISNRFEQVSNIALRRYLDCCKVLIPPNIPSLKGKFDEENWVDFTKELSETCENSSIDAKKKSLIQSTIYEIEIAEIVDIGKRAGLILEGCDKEIALFPLVLLPIIYKYLLPEGKITCYQKELNSHEAQGRKAWNDQSTIFQSMPPRSEREGNSQKITNGQGFIIGGHSMFPPCGRTERDNIAKNTAGDSTDDEHISSEDIAVEVAGGPTQ